ncbi:hypothetical protein [Deinococcus navajonensis]|uniref:Uncharacterized protein n=1 Tax=Deinococcus navajonensis TaxID=309884 RepID=A0ABV8XRE3_9DEIO
MKKYLYAAIVLLALPNAQAASEIKVGSWEITLNTDEWGSPRQIAYAHSGKTDLRVRCDSDGLQVYLTDDRFFDDFRFGMTEAEVRWQITPKMKSISKQQDWELASSYTGIFVPDTTIPGFIQALKTGRSFRIMINGVRGVKEYKIANISGFDKAVRYLKCVK